jgi:hypothetical protein
MESQYKWYKHKQYNKLQQTYWMEVSGQHHALALLLQGKSPWYTSSRKLSGLQYQPGSSGEEKNLLLLSDLKPQYSTLGEMRKAYTFLVR